MANYKESNIDGKSWVRSNEISIRNEFDGIPSILFKEELVYNIDNTIIKSPFQTRTSPGGLSARFLNPNEQFPLINPETGDEMGMTKLNDFRIILHSLYTYLANKRDLEETPEGTIG